MGSFMYMYEYNYNDPLDDSSNVTANTSSPNTTWPPTSQSREGAQTMVDSDSNKELVQLVQTYFHGFIIFLGLITNTLTLVVLYRKKIGSQTTRMILACLAGADLSVMLVQLFTAFLPAILKAGAFNLYTTDLLPLKIAMMANFSTTTASSWYIVALTAERLTVVWCPMKTKAICTSTKTLTVCIAIPLLTLLIYSYLPIGNFVLNPEEMFVVSYIWTTLYFFVPALLIAVLNTGLVRELTKAYKAEKLIMTCGGTKLGPESLLRSSRSSSRNSSNLRKATKLVLAASITFLVLMLPQGVITALVLTNKWVYNCLACSIVKRSAYILHCLNHAVNFFLYILTNNKFRKEIRRMFCWTKRRSNQQGASITTTSGKKTDLSPTPVAHAQTASAEDHHV